MASNKPHGIPPKKSDEKEFDRIMRERYLQPFLDGVLEEVRRVNASTPAGEIAAVFAFVEYWRRTRDPDFPVEAVREWARGVDIRHSKAFAIDMRRMPGGAPDPNFQYADTAPILARTVNESVDLIKTIPRRFHTTLANKIIRAERQAPLDLQDRRRIFRETGKLSGYVLRRLTRDQSNKLTGALSIYRMGEAGIFSYRWSTSLDERVRPLHAARQGQVYSIATGTGLQGDMHPGQAIQCRCVAIPVIDSDDRG